MKNQKGLRLVSGIIYDDAFEMMYGGSRFYHLNGDIETDETGNEIYIVSRKKENSSESEDVAYPVKNMPKLVQRYIKKHTQTVVDRNEAQYICVHSQDLLMPKRRNII